MVYKKLSLVVIVFVLISCTPNAELTITGKVRDVSLSANVINLQEPVNGFTTIALEERCELLGFDKRNITLREIQPGMQIAVSGQQGESGSLLATQVVVIPLEEPTTSTQPKELDSLDVGLTAQLEVPEYLPSGEEVEITFTLTNTSDTPLYVLKWYTPLEGIAGEIFRVTRDGQTIPYEGILAYRDSPLPEDYILLNPNQSIKASMHFEPSYDFSKPGNYEIKFLSPRISHVACAEEEFAKSMDDLGPVQISSNTVTLEIGDE